MKNQLAAILIGTVFALLIVELMLRAFGLVQLTDEYLPQDNYLKFKLKPGIDKVLYSADKTPFEMKTNSLGFQDIGFRDEGLDGIPYAVVVGDSFTFGLGVDANETWVKLLQTKTNHHFTNMGVVSYSTVAEERTLEKYGIKLKPKLVIVGFAINDYSDSYDFFNNVSVTKNFLDSLREKIAIYKFLWQRLGELKHDTEIIKYKDESLDFIFWPQPAMDDVSSRYEKVNVGEKFAQESFLRIKKLADDNNATLIVVLLPAKEQVYWNIVSKLVRNPQDYEFDFPTDSMNKFCTLNKLNCLDLAPKFREKAKMGGQLFFRIDSHYNKLGNELVANEIYNYLRQIGAI